MTVYNPRERYRSINGKKLVEIRVRSALQLFDARDPAPFRARDLDDDFAEYVMASAEEIGSDPMKIVILVEEPENPEIKAEAITESIRSFLLYQIDLRRLQLTKLFRTVRLFLGIGLICVVICLFVARLVEESLHGTPHGQILREGLIIFGWVSLWKPFELILFDWYPMYDRIRLFRRLLATEIEVQFGRAA